MATKAPKATKSIKAPNTMTTDTAPAPAPAKEPKKSLKKLTIINPSATPEEIENTIVQEMSAISMSASSETELGKYQKT